MTTERVEKVAEVWEAIQEQLVEHGQVYAYQPYQLTNDGILDDVPYRNESFRNCANCWPIKISSASNTRNPTTKDPYASSGS